MDSVWLYVIGSIFALILIIAAVLSVWAALDPEG